MLLASIRVPAEIFGSPLVTVSRDFSHFAFWCSRRGGSVIFNVLGSFWGRFGVFLGSFWDRFGIDSESIRG